MIRTVNDLMSQKFVHRTMQDRFFILFLVFLFFDFSFSYDGSFCNDPISHKFIYRTKQDYWIPTAIWLFDL